MKPRRLRSRRGATALEFTMAGVPLMFMLFSVFESARGMWTYEMMAYAVREGTRYAAMHGRGCGTPNSCQVTIGQLASYIHTAGPLISSSSTLTFTPATGTATSGTISSLASNSTVWPPTGANSPGQNVKISVSYPFQTVLAVFWAGAGPPLNDSQTFTLRASSTEPIQF